MCCPGEAARRPRLVAGVPPVVCKVVESVVTLRLERLGREPRCARRAVSGRARPAGRCVPPSGRTRSDRCRSPPRIRACRLVDEIVEDAAAGRRHDREDLDVERTACRRSPPTRARRACRRPAGRDVAARPRGPTRGSAQGHPRRCAVSATPAAGARSACREQRAHRWSRRARDAPAPRRAGGRSGVEVRTSVPMSSTVSGPSSIWLTLVDGRIAPDEVASAAVVRRAGRPRTRRRPAAARRRARSPRGAAAAASTPMRGGDRR